MVLVEAVVLQHPVEPLQILNVMLECYLLLPAAYKENTDTHQPRGQQPDGPLQDHLMERMSGNKQLQQSVRKPCYMDD